MKKFLLVVLVILMLGMAVSVHAQERRDLTLDRAVIISDTEIVLEFSEPIVLNKFQSSRGPWLDIRIVDKWDSTRYTYDSHGVGTAIQWDGTTQWVDEKHDRILFTLTEERLGCNTLSEIMSFSGELAEFKDNGWKAIITIEEVPSTTPAADGRVENITTLDGEVYLWPTRPTGWEAANMDLTSDIIDYSYHIDRSRLLPFSGADQSWDFDIVSVGDGPEFEEINTELQTEIVQQTVIRNNPLRIVLILGVGLGVAVISSVVILVVQKKRKAAQR